MCLGFVQVSHKRMLGIQLIYPVYTASRAQRCELNWIPYLDKDA